jgi:hypothetical protein
MEKTPNQSFKVGTSKKTLLKVILTIQKYDNSPIKDSIKKNSDLSSELRHISYQNQWVGQCLQSCTSWNNSGKAGICGLDTLDANVLSTIQLGNLLHHCSMHVRFLSIKKLLSDKYRWYSPHGKKRLTFSPVLKEEKIIIHKWYS